MTVTLAVCGALIVLLAARPWRVPGVAAVAGWVLGGPILALAGVAGVVLVLRLARLRRARADTARRAGETVVAVEATALGVTGGLTFDAACDLAAGLVGGGVGADIGSALRQRSAGVSVRVADPTLGAMFDAADRAAVLGSPIAADLTALVREAREERAVSGRERLARLPVRLVVPLALLILPGFVLMTVGPTIAVAVERLGL